MCEEDFVIDEWTWPLRISTTDTRFPHHSLRPKADLYTYTSKHLVHPSVSGLHANLMDSLNLKYVSLDKDWKPEDEG